MVFFAPCPQRQFNHFELYRVFYGFSDDVISIDWSTDSSNSLSSITVSTDGDVCLWEADTELSQLDQDDCTKTLFHLKQRFHHAPTDEKGAQSLVSSVSFHKQLQLLATGFTSGLLTLHSLPEFSVITEVKLFADPITSLSINSSGDWLCAASDSHGQLVVWEWRSQASYLKAESHSSHMTSLAYSPDGLYLATGGYDNKVKVWRVAGGRAVVTFTEHQAAVTGVVFPALKAKVVISASLDGTVRAHDLVRYRNFRTLSVPTRQVQFACLAVDAPGTLVAAGGLDSFEAFVWSVKTGVLLATLTGHTAPVSALAFSPDVTSCGIELSSVSWDQTLRVWDLAGNSGDENNLTNMGSVKEVVHFSHDILCVAYRGDGKEIAIALLNADIVLYDPNEGMEKGTICGKHDLGVGQTTDLDLVTPKRSAQAKKFQTIAYSADGEHLLAAGDSKYVCLYSIPDRLLVKRFELTCNLSMRGVQEVHDRRRYLAALQSSAGSVLAMEQHSSLPIPPSKERVAGVDRSRRELKAEIRVSAVQFSPTGDAFAVTSTEGVLLYSLDTAGTGFHLSSLFDTDSTTSGFHFTGVALDEDVTPSNTRLALANGDHARALDMAFRLRLQNLLEEVFEAIPMDQTRLILSEHEHNRHTVLTTCHHHNLPPPPAVDFLSRQLPINQVVHCVIPFLARQLAGRSRHVEFYVHWTDSVLRAHSLTLRRGTGSWSSAIQSTSTLDTPGTDAKSKAMNVAIQQPGLLTDRGEWATCQASLVRLQASLERVKTGVVQRLEAVDNLWRYLDTVAHLKTKSLQVDNVSKDEILMEIDSNEKANIQSPHSDKKLGKKKRSSSSGMSKMQNPSLPA